MIQLLLGCLWTVAHAPVLLWTSALAVLQPCSMKYPCVPIRPKAIRSCAEEVRSCSRLLSEPQRHFRLSSADRRRMPATEEEPSHSSQTRPAREQSIQKSFQSRQELFAAAAAAALAFASRRVVSRLKPWASSQAAKPARKVASQSEHPQAGCASRQASESERST